MNVALEQLNKIVAMIAKAREAVSAGEIINLTEIQTQVHDICLNIQNTAPEDAEEVQSSIVSMIADLNKLAEELQSQQQSLGTDVIRQAVRSTYTSPKDKN